MANGNNNNFTTTMKTLIISFGGDGLLYYSIDNKSVPLHVVQGNIFKINERFHTIDNKTDYQIQELQTTDGIRTFRYFIPSKNTYVSRGGGGGGISGINVQDEGIQFGGQFITLNFAGASVVVTDDGGGKATITIGDGGTITGGGTLNRLAMFTGATSIGDSPFLRSGSDVIADGFIYFNSGNGIDVVASGGADILNIGTSNADVINYGYAGTTHNMNGTVFNVFTTNLNVTDKIITLNDGGAGGSGGNVGFEIEEAGVATGYFIQNTTRDGFDFQASAVTGVATFSLALLTANRTATLQDASGTIAYLSDIPVNAFVQNGNSFGANAVLGTNDAFSLSFETSGVTRETISATGLFGINTTPVVGTLVTVQSTGATNLTWIEQWYNSTPTLLFGVRDDGYITAGIANGSMTIGLGSGFDSTLRSNTFIGVAISSGITGTGEFNTSVGHQSLNANTSGQENNAFGFQALFLNTTGDKNCAFGSYALTSNVTAGDGNNNAFGHQALTSNTTGIDNCAFGTQALASNTTGDFNVAMGKLALQALVGVSYNNTAIGGNALFSSTSGNSNVALGTNAGLTGVTGARNVFLGYYSGAYELGSDALYIDDRDRTNTTGDKTLALVYANFADATSGQFFRHNSNVGIRTHDFGTGTPDGVLSIFNAGAVPTSSPANQITIYSVDTDDATASLGLRTEQAVVTEAVISDRTLKATINGTVYKICLKV